jgi:hypothetical protein
MTAAKVEGAGIEVRTCLKFLSEELAQNVIVPKLIPAMGNSENSGPKGLNVSWGKRVGAEAFARLFHFFNVAKELLSKFSGGEQASDPEASRRGRGDAPQAIPKVGSSSRK